MAADPSTLRHTVRQALLALVDPTALEGWFDSLDFQREDGVLLVRLSQPQMHGWFRENVEPLLARALTPLGLAVRVAPPPLPFDPTYCLDAFLANTKNAFPLASAKQVAEDDTARFNPLTVCGETGSGKTFLLRAIANAKAQQGKAVLATTVADLATCYAQRPDAQAWALGHEVFLLDDLQDLEFYEALQGELTLLFDRFHCTRRQMVFACSGSLAACSFLQPKLRSRLEWGLMITLKAPDLDVRLQFVAQWRKRHGLALSREREVLLAHRFTDMRLLEGMLLKLLAYSDLVSPTITDEEFANILHYSNAPMASPAQAKDIIALVCQTLGVPLEEVMAQGRRRDIVWARQVAMYLCRNQLRLSYPQIGQLFGGRDHTTALYACRKVESELARNALRKAQVQDIALRLRTLSNPQP